MPVRTSVREEPRTGAFPNSMEYLTVGDGPRRLLVLPGGPGSSVPSGLMRRARLRWCAPFIASGYTVWLVTRRRHMPAGHGVADIADDYAGLIAEEFGGSVHLVVGESYGGMIAQHLAATHPSCVSQVALVVTGCEVNAWGKAVDRGWPTPCNAATGPRPAPRSPSTCCRATAGERSGDCSGRWWPDPRSPGPPPRTSWWSWNRSCASTLVPYSPASPPRSC